MNQLRQETAKEYAKVKRYLSLADLGMGGILLMLLAFSDLFLRLAGLLILPLIPIVTIYFVILTVTYGLLSAPLREINGKGK
ncbi:MAG TPA: hypothetical protein G4N93_05075 [Dehalococcoidia bacterium]|nr:hypothetical protein [Dehalococcoidia bacterium]